MNLIVLATTVLVCGVLERLARYRYRNAAFFRDYFPSDVLYLLTAVGLGFWMGLTYVTPATDWIEARVIIPRLARLELSNWVLLPAGLILVDFGNWVAHYLLHRSNTLWELHKVHHSSRVVDWLATFRSHVGEQILRNLMGPMLLIAIGFPLDVTLFATGLYGAVAVFQHSNTALNLRAIESVFITPRLHRMHHLPGGTCQKNFGTVLSLWDRLFGTFEAADVDPVEFGVPGEVKTYPQTWARQLVEPFKRYLQPPRSGAQQN